MFMFNKDEYFSYLDTVKLGRNIFIYDEVNSTNDIILNGEFEYGDVVLSLMQTQGKGRSGRTWYDNGHSLIFSIALNGLDNKILMPLNIIAGYAICNAMSFYVPVKLKWPNDCVIDGKKVCGMLLESTCIGNDYKKIVFGAGINIFNTNMPNDIAYKSTNIAQYTNIEVSKELLLSKILIEMENMMNSYSNGSLSIEALWYKYSAHYNQEISIHINGVKTQMIEKGILPNGELIVEDINTGTKKNINIGEIGYDFNS